MLAKGKLCFTQEMLQKVLELPENIIITDADFESNRDIVSFYVRSLEPIKGLTYKTDEGASAVSRTIDTSALEE
ncbi:hypothetical protein [Bacillus cereus group sp. Bce040]|uniref:hypothetical protein n=1 Tax=Bacillus cereus group sp. Bce040 TaxID=3445229 RepID=UPI003F213B44